MKKIVYIEKSGPLRDFILLMAKEVQVEAFTYDGSEPMEFYVKDISPDFLILDLETLGIGQIEQLLGGLSSQITVFVTCKDEEKEQVRELAVTVWPKPLSFDDFLKNLQLEIK